MDDQPMYTSSLPSLPECQPSNKTMSQAAGDALESWLSEESHLSSDCSGSAQSAHGSGETGQSQSELRDPSEFNGGSRLVGMALPPVASASTTGSQRLAHDSFLLAQHRGKIKRILDRDGGQSQSTRAFHVRKKRKIYAMFIYDLFHTVLELPFLGLYPMVFCLYALCHFIFALVWWSISDSCAIGLSSLLSAFYFSVETQMTIGYGAPKENFDGCPEAVFLLPLQVVCGQFLDAAVIGVVFAQISAASAHAASVMFSDTALLRVIDGCAYLTFRIAKRTGFTLSQGKIQVYCVQHHKDPTQPKGVRVEINAMDLIEPDMDMHNGVIFLGLPTEVVHKVDYESPLSPVVPRGTEGHPHELDVRTYMRQSTYMEVLVLVSGVEQTTAASFEARHSYTLDDIFWDRTFAPCVSINERGYHTVDLFSFHQSHMNRDESMVNSLDHAISTRTHPSILATLHPQVADWTIYQSRWPGVAAGRLEELFSFSSRQVSHSDIFTRQNSYNAGDSP